MTTHLHDGFRIFGSEDNGTFVEFQKGRQTAWKTVLFTDSCQSSVMYCLFESFAAFHGFAFFGTLSFHVLVLRVSCFGNFVGKDVSLLADF